MIRNEVWVLCKFTERSCGWNQTREAFELNQEGSWRDGPLSPAFATEQDAFNYIDKLIASRNCFRREELIPTRLRFFESEHAYLAEPFVEAERQPDKLEKISRTELLEQLLPEINKLFGMDHKEYKNYDKK